MAVVKVLYFAVLRERRGCTEERVTVTSGETVESLYHRLFPATAAGRLPVAYAVDQAYVAGDHRLRDGAEVAFIPPVGGG